MVGSWQITWCLCFKVAKNEEAAGTALSEFMDRDTDEVTSHGYMTEEDLVAQGVLRILLIIF